jgi:adsorption protein B
VQRFHSVFHVYGFTQACVSVPRLVWGNFINFFATMRALRIFAASKRSGKTITWDKTAHVFPPESELSALRVRLGDLLVKKRHISIANLDEALDEQRHSSRLLGQILVAKGWLTESVLVKTLAAQLSVRSRTVDPRTTPEHLLAAVPRVVMIRYSVFPVDARPDGTLVLVSERIPTPQEIVSLEDALERPVEIELCTRSDIAFAIARPAGFRQDATESRLGEQLLLSGRITEQQLNAAFGIQRESYQRLGDILLDQGAISAATLNEALSAFPFNGAIRLGEFLVSKGLITGHQLANALRSQESGFIGLEIALVNTGAIAVPVELEECPPA